MAQVCTFSDWNVRNAIIEALVLRNPRTCPTPLASHIYLGDSIASSVIRLVDSIQTYLAFWSEGRYRAKRVAVAVVGENAPSLARRLSMRLNRTSLGCAMFFLS